MKIISIEGNIGSGKSTFLNFLKQSFTNPRVCFLDEPVELWSTVVDEEGVTILENFYKDKSYSFSFQMLAYISRLSILKKAIQSKQYDIIIMERSLDTDKNVFCQMLYDKKDINQIEFTIYNKWFDEFKVNHVIEYVYLKTRPDVSFERVLKRNRTGETIPLAYLEQCHEYHENWLKYEKCLVLDANTHVLSDHFNAFIDLL